MVPANAFSMQSPIKRVSPGFFNCRRCACVSMQIRITVTWRSRQLLPPRERRSPISQWLRTVNVYFQAILHPTRGVECKIHRIGVNAACLLIALVVFKSISPATASTRMNRNDEERLMDRSGVQPFSVRQKKWSKVYTGNCNLELIIQFKKKGKKGGRLFRWQKTLKRAHQTHAAAKLARNNDPARSRPMFTLNRIGVI